MKIATIILNYNSNADCRKCIGYLKQQQCVEQEIVVVDNCSRDDEREAVEVLCKEQGRTFIANIYKKVPDPNVIGAMTGHVEGSHAFFRYRTIEDEVKKSLVDILG